VSWTEYKALEGAFTNTATDTENHRIPNWNAKNASRGVRNVRDSPAINIKSLGDTTNNPASTSSRMNVANDQAVTVPSASSRLIVAADGSAF